MCGEKGGCLPQTALHHMHTKHACCSSMSWVVVCAVLCLYQMWFCMPPPSSLNNQGLQQSAECVCVCVGGGGWGGGAFEVWPK
jgi:hypothetical protein